MTGMEVKMYLRMHKGTVRTFILGLLGKNLCSATLAPQNKHAVENYLELR